MRSFFIILHYFYILQTFIVDFILFKKFKEWFSFLSPDNLPYENIEKETRNNTLWLPNPPRNTPNLSGTRIISQNNQMDLMNQPTTIAQPILLNGMANHDNKFVNIWFRNLKPLFSAIAFRHYLWLCSLFIILTVVLFFLAFLYVVYKFWNIFILFV